MKGLVTGGAGFIGSHVADSLLAEGREVAIVDDPYRGRRQNVGEGAAFYELDVSRVGFVGVHQRHTPVCRVRLAGRLC
jgi:UDP-glucose 4-epimerase